MKTIFVAIVLVAVSCCPAQSAPTFENSCYFDAFSASQCTARNVQYTLMYDGEFCMVGGDNEDDWCPLFISADKCNSKHVSLEYRPVMKACMAFMDK